MKPTPLKTFIVYARDDKQHKDQLLRHLRPLVHNRYLDIWHDGDILPGEDWEKLIKTNLKASQVVLVLVSVNSLNSDFIQSEELATAVEQLTQGHTRIVPIIVAPCVWRYHQLFAGLQGLPEDMRPVVSWANTDEAWTNVADSLAGMVEEFRGKAAEAEKRQQYEVAVATAWQSAERENTRRAYLDFAKEYADHVLAREAKGRLAQMPRPEPVLKKYHLLGFGGLFTLALLLFLWVKNDTPNPFDTEDVPATEIFSSQRGHLIWPVEQARVIQGFGAFPHPKYKGVILSNSGLDLGTISGGKVSAVFEGKVVATQFINGYQYTVILQHSTYYTVYSNLASVSIKQGDVVSTGQEIGLVGPEKPEMHFELWRDKQKLDPAMWLERK